jgi:hypothetical protein
MSVGVFAVAERAASPWPGTRYSVTRRIRLDHLIPAVFSVN